MIPIIEIRDKIKSYYYKNFIFSDLFVIWYKKNLVIFWYTYNKDLKDSSHARSFPVICIWKKVNWHYYIIKNI